MCEREWADDCFGFELLGDAWSESESTYVGTIEDYVAVSRKWVIFTTATNAANVNVNVNTNDDDRGTGYCRSTGRSKSRWELHAADQGNHAPPVLRQPLHARLGRPPRAPVAGAGLGADAQRGHRRAAAALAPVPLRAVAAHGDAVRVDLVAGLVVVPAGGVGHEHEYEREREFSRFGFGPRGGGGAGGKGNKPACAFFKFNFSSTGVATTHAGDLFDDYYYFDYFFWEVQRGSDEKIFGRYTS